MSSRKLESWFREGMSWRLKNWSRWYFDRVAIPLSAHSGELARRAFWPLPWLAPYRRKHLHVSRDRALGDVLLSTPALREVKRLNPSCFVSFYTDYPQLVEGLPFIDEVKKFADRPTETIFLAYEPCIPPKRHIARILGEVIGVCVRSVRPSCVIDSDLVTRFRRQFQGMSRPHVVINRSAGPWTPNKEWPAEYWNQLVSMLTKEGSVIEVGTAKEDSGVPASDHYLSLIGRTSLPELIASIAAADALVSPISGPVHIAAAAGVPAVVIYGGYEDPVCSRYPGNINLYTPEECSPCWLRSPCPNDKKCLREILPSRVRQAVQSLLEKPKTRRQTVGVLAR